MAPIDVAGRGLGAGLLQMVLPEFVGEQERDDQKRQDEECAQDETFGHDSLHAHATCEGCATLDGSLYAAGPRAQETARAVAGAAEGISEGARILAMHNVLGDDAKHIDDQNLLLLGNQIHNKANALLNADGARKRIEDVLTHAGAENSAAIELSAQLLIFE